MRRYSDVAVAILVAVLSGSAAADTTHSISYTYYTVGGSTPEAIYRAILDRGPEVHGNKALASSAATTRQSGKLMQGPRSCRVVDYGLTLDFVIKLPRIKNEKVLPPAQRKLWRQFSKFLAAHEEHHAAVWLGCAANLTRKVNAIKVRSCTEASRKASQLWKDMLASCDKQQAAFDDAERQHLMVQPFMKAVARGAKVR